MSENTQQIVKSGGKSRNMADVTDWQLTYKKGLFRFDTGRYHWKFTERGFIKKLFGKSLEELRKD